MKNAVLEKDNDQKIDISKEENPEVIEQTEDKTLENIFPGKNAENKDALEQILTGIVKYEPDKEKSKEILFGFYKGLRSAYHKPEITKKYSIHHSSNDKELIRLVETWMDGCRDYNKTILEKYNPETDIWEEWEKERKAPEQIKEQLENIEFKIYDAIYQLEAVSEMSLKILYSGEDKNFNSIPIFELIKEKSKYIENLTEEINSLRNHIN